MWGIELGRELCASQQVHRAGLRMGSWHRWWKHDACEQTACSKTRASRQHSFLGLQAREAESTKGGAMKGLSSCLLASHAVSAGASCVLIAGCRRTVFVTAYRSWYEWLELCNLLLILLLALSHHASSAVL